MMRFWAENEPPGAVWGTEGEPARGRTTYVVDDDREVRASLALLLRGQGIVSRGFAGAADLLDELPHLAPGCLLIDIRMPGISGVELLEELRARECRWPAVMISGHGEIGLAVKTIKLGATDFLEKPFSDERLQEALCEAFVALEEAEQVSRACRSALRLQALSPRERQVFDGVITGKTSKQIAAAYKLSPRTVEAYRLHMMTKLGARNLHDLLAISGTVPRLSG